MQLTTKGRYAVMALVEISARNRFVENNVTVSLSEIAKSQDITLAYLEQIFSKLKNAGIVKSVRGPGGGYVLTKTPCNTNIAEIIDAVEEKTKMTRCGNEKETGCKAGGKCTTHDLWEGLGNTIKNYFVSITLKDVVEGKIRVQNSELRIQ